MYVAAVGAVASTDSEGSPYPTAQSAAVVACAVAQAFAAAAQRYAEEANEMGFVPGTTIGGVNVAVHQGEVASGLIGAGPVTFDVWGPAVSTTKALAALAPLHGVVATEPVATAVRRAGGGSAGEVWRFEAFSAGSEGGFGSGGAAAVATAGTQLFRLLALDEGGRGGSDEGKYTSNPTCNLIYSGVYERMLVVAVLDVGSEDNVQDAGGEGSRGGGSREMSADVAGSCAFPGTNQWECLPPAHRASINSDGA